MTTMMTHVEPEEMMAWLDGELPVEEAGTVAAHVEECAVCATVAAQFRKTSEELAGWSLPDAPTSVETTVIRAMRTRVRRPSGGRWHWGLWGVGLGAVAAMLLVTTLATEHAHRSSTFGVAQVRTLEQLSTAPAPVPLYDRVDKYEDVASAPNKYQKSDRATSSALGSPAAEVDRKQVGGGQPVSRGQLPKFSEEQIAAPRSDVATAPMIARTVSLTMRVKDANGARATLEAMLAQHHGYMAQLNASAAEGSARTLQASLRIPAGELGAALGEMRSLGRVDNETQSGEEVTSQHEDLAARLKNSREEEARLQSILQQKTSRMSDVLEVEEEIAQVRGQIEAMETEQAGLEHRVVFANVEVLLTEEYKAEFHAPDSVGARLHNALVSGYANARDSALGVVLFLEEYGPAMLVWLIVLGGPVFWGWRRYRRVPRA